jgi:hypothetical protein
MGHSTSRRRISHIDQSTSCDSTVLHRPPLSVASSTVRIPQACRIILATPFRRSLVDTLRWSLISPRVPRPFSKLHTAASACPSLCAIPILADLRCSSLHTMGAPEYECAQFSRPRVALLRPVAAPRAWSSGKLDGPACATRSSPSVDGSHMVRESLERRLA